MFGRESERPTTTSAAPAKMWLPSMARLKSLLTLRERSGSVADLRPKAHFPSAQRRVSVELERPPDCLVHRSAEDCDCEKIAMPLCSSYQASKTLRIKRSGSSSAAASTGKASTGMASSRYGEEVSDAVSEFTAEAATAAAKFFPNRSSEAVSNSTRSTESSASARRRELRLRGSEFGIKMPVWCEPDRCLDWTWEPSCPVEGFSACPEQTSPLAVRASLNAGERISPLAARASSNDSAVAYHASSGNPTSPPTTTFSTDQFPPQRTPKWGKPNMLPAPASRPEAPSQNVPLSLGERGRARQASEASLASPALRREASLASPILRREASLASPAHRRANLLKN